MNFEASRQSLNKPENVTSNEKPEILLSTDSSMGNLEISQKNPNEPENETSIGNPEIILSTDSSIDSPENASENETSNDRPEICLDTTESSIVHQIINHQPVDERGVQGLPETYLEISNLESTSKSNKSDAFSIAGSQSNSVGNETYKKNSKSKHKTEFQTEWLTKFPWLRHETIENNDFLFCKLCL